MKTCIIAGSFDPITCGHMDIITRAGQIFEHIIVAVLVNAGKHPLFTLEERKMLLETSLRHLQNIEVDSFEGLLADYAKARGVNILVRGVRSVADYEYERDIAAINAHLNPGLETVLLPATAPQAHVSSSVVKELGAHGGEIRGWVPDVVVDEIQKVLQRRKGGQVQ